MLLTTRLRDSGVRLCLQSPPSTAGAPPCAMAAGLLLPSIDHPILRSRQSTGAPPTISDDQPSEFADNAGRSSETRAHVRRSRARKRASRGRRRRRQEARGSPFNYGRIAWRRRSRRTWKQLNEAFSVNSPSAIVIFSTPKDLLSLRAPQYSGTPAYLKREGCTNSP